MNREKEICQEIEKLLFELKVRQDIQQAKIAHENGWDPNELMKDAMAKGLTSFFVEGLHDRPKPVDSAS